MRFRYWILAMMVLLFASCSNDEILRVAGDEDALSDLVTEVSASCGSFTTGITRGTNDSDCCSASACKDKCTCNGACTNLTSDGDKKMVKNTCPEDDAYILGMKDFQENDRIYILQRGPNLEPKFPGTFFDHRNDNDAQYKAYKESNNLDNIYIYEYNPNLSDTAAWSESIGGTNFEYNSQRCDPISWGKVKSNGSVGNSFVFFAFCDNLKDLEPKDEDLLYKSDGVDFYHHAYGGKWKKSDNVGGGYDYSNDWHAYHYQNHCGVPDFLGAYHTTLSLYERPKFMFYHLLAYVRVTLYVPVVDTYEEKDSKTGNTVKRTTGYDETAFVLSNQGENLKYSGGVWIGDNTSGKRQMRTRFTIDWAAKPSSNEAPQTKILYNATTPGFLFAYCMYRHNPLDVTDLRYKPKTAADDLADIKKGIGIEKFNVSDFLKGINNQTKFANATKYLTPDENGNYYDEVRRYEFSAAMPAQTVQTSGTIEGTSNTATNTLMQIHLRLPGADSDRIKNENDSYNSFAEYTLSTLNLLSTNNNLELGANTITHLRVYLPRAADEAILVQAEVKPWGETKTEMTVTPDDWGY